MTRVAIFLLLCLLNPGSVLGASLHETPIGTKVSTKFELGRMQIPLPKGEWVLIGRTELGSGGLGFRVPIALVYLAQWKDGVLARAVVAETNLVESPGGWTRDQNCDRVDMHHVVSDRNYNSKSQECWWINHFTQTLGANPPAHFRQAFDYMDANRISRPTTLIGVSYRLVRSFQYLHVRYNVNPDLEGIVQTRTMTWRENDWHRDLLQNDPKKVEYIRRQIAWGTEWFPRVKDGFNR